LVIRHTAVKVLPLLALNLWTSDKRASGLQCPIASPTTLGIGGHVSVDIAPPPWVA
jgi:hypothetical protein